MKSIQVKPSDVKAILRTAEVLLDRVEHVLNQDDVAKRRLADIKKGNRKTVSEKAISGYLHNRGVLLE